MRPRVGVAAHEDDEVGEPERREDGDDRDRRAVEAAVHRPQPRDVAARRHQRRPAARAHRRGDVGPLPLAPHRRRRAARRQQQRARQDDGAVVQRPRDDEAAAAVLRRRRRDEEGVDGDEQHDDDPEDGDVRALLRKVEVDGELALDGALLEHAVPQLPQQRRRRRHRHLPAQPRDRAEDDVDVSVGRVRWRDGADDRGRPRRGGDCGRARRAGDGHGRRVRHRRRTAGGAARAAASRGAAGRRRARQRVTALRPQKLAGWPGTQLPCGDARSVRSPAESRTNTLRRRAALVSAAGVPPPILRPRNVAARTRRLRAHAAPAEPSTRHAIRLTARSVRASRARARFRSSAPSNEQRR